MTAALDVTLVRSDLARALIATIPHAADPDEPRSTIRIETIPALGICVSATDGYTAALVRADTLALTMPGMVDITVTDAKRILAFYPAKKAVDGPEWMLRLRAEDGQLTVTDCSGLLEEAEDELTVSAATTPATLDALDTAAVIRRMLSRPRAVNARYWADAERIRRFLPAAKAFDTAPRFIPLHAQALQTTVVVLIGDAMIGAMATSAADDDDCTAPWHQDLPTFPRQIHTPVVTVVSSQTEAATDDDTPAPPPPPFLRLVEMADDNDGYGYRDGDEP